MDQFVAAYRTNWFQTFKFIKIINYISKKSSFVLLTRAICHMVEKRAVVYKITDVELTQYQ